jgi:hypothetical protein
LIALIIDAFDRDQMSGVRDRIEILSQSLKSNPHTFHPPVRANGTGIDFGHLPRREMTFKDQFASNIAGSLAVKQSPLTEDADTRKDQTKTARCHGPNLVVRVKPDMFSLYNVEFFHLAAQDIPRLA